MDIAALSWSVNDASLILYSYSLSRTMPLTFCTVTAFRERCLPHFVQLQPLTSWSVDIAALSWSVNDASLILYSYSLSRLGQWILPPCLGQLTMPLSFCTVRAFHERCLSHFVQLQPFTSWPVDIAALSWSVNDASLILYSYSLSRLGQWILPPCLGQLTMPLSFCTVTASHVLASGYCRPVLVS